MFIQTESFTPTGRHNLPRVHWLSFCYVMVGPLQSGIFTLRSAATKKPPVLSRWGSTRSSFAPSYCLCAIYKSRLSNYYYIYRSFYVCNVVLSSTQLSKLCMWYLLSEFGTVVHVDIYRKTRCSVAMSAIPLHECNFTLASFKIAFTSNSSTLSLYVFNACAMTFSFYSGFKLQVL